MAKVRYVERFALLHLYYIELEWHHRDFEYRPKYQVELRKKKRLHKNSGRNVNVDSTGPLRGFNSLFYPYKLCQEKLNVFFVSTSKVIPMGFL